MQENKILKHCKYLISNILTEGDLLQHCYVHCLLAQVCNKFSYCGRVKRPSSLKLAAKTKHRFVSGDVGAVCLTLKKVDS